MHPWNFFIYTKICFVASRALYTCWFMARRSQANSYIVHAFLGLWLHIRVEDAQELVSIYFFSILCTVKRYLSAQVLFMRIMQVKWPSHKFVLHKILSRHMFVMHATFKRINKNCLNILRGPFLPIDIIFHAQKNVPLWYY